MSNLNGHFSSHDVITTDVAHGERLPRLSDIVRQMKANVPHAYKDVNPKPFVPRKSDYVPKAKTPKKPPFKLVEKPFLPFTGECKTWVSIPNAANHFGCVGDTIHKRIAAGMITNFKPAPIGLRGQLISMEETAWCFEQRPLRRKRKLNGIGERCEYFKTYYKKKKAT